MIFLSLHDDVNFIIANHLASDLKTRGMLRTYLHACIWIGGRGHEDAQRLAKRHGVFEHEYK